MATWFTQVIDYTIEDDVTVNHVEQAVFTNRVMPAFWYVAKPLKEEECPEAFKQGLSSWYLTDNGWQSSTPKQFSCAFQARVFYEMAKKEGLLDKYTNYWPSIL